MSSLSRLLLSCCLLSLSMVASTAAQPSGYLSAGIDHAVALHGDGSVWAWGGNAYGQLGDGSWGDQPHPVPVLRDTGEPLAGIQAVASRGWHSVAIDAGNRVWAWGRGNHGQLGDGSSTHSNRAVAVTREGGSLLGGVVSVACGQQHTLALHGGGSVWAWGRGGDGQIGDGEAEDTPRAVRVLRRTVGGGTTLLDGVEAVAAGRYHSLALRNGEVWAWGANDEGQVGAADALLAYDVATRVVRADDGSPVANARVITAGQYFSLALTTDGKLLAWGRNTYGQFGDGTTIGSNRAMEVSLDGLGGVSLARLVAGSEHVLALTDNGEVWGWGSNEHLQLALPPANPYGSEVPILLTDGAGSPLTGIMDIAVGKYFSLVAEGASRRVRSWGDNDEGQLGQGQPSYCDCWRAELVVFADGEPFLISSPESSPATGILLSPTGTVSGTVTVTADVQDPDGLEQVWVTFIAAGPALAVCGAGSSACTGTAPFSVAEVDPRDYGAAFGEITVRLFVQDSLGEVVQVDDSIFVLEPEDGAQTFLLTVVKQGTGDGVLVSTPAGIECGIGCAQQSAEFLDGSEITLDAIGEGFVGFAGESCFGHAPCTLTVDRDLEQRAIFQVNQGFSVTGTAPTDGSTSASTEDSIFFIFDRDIQPGPAWNDIVFRELGGDSVSFQPKIEASWPDRLFLSSASLSEGRDYEVILPSAAVSDLAGTPLPGEGYLGFRTATTGAPRLFVAAFPELLVEGGQSTIQVWFDRPASVVRTVELSADPADALDLPATVTIPAGEVMASFVASGLSVPWDTTVVLRASEATHGTAGVTLRVGDTTPWGGAPFRFHSFTFVSDAEGDGDGEFDAGDDADFQLMACNDGDLTVLAPEACLSIVDVASWTEVNLPIACKQIGAMLPGECSTRIFELQAGTDLPAREYWVRIDGTSSINDFIAYEGIEVVNEALPDYELSRSSRNLLVVEPGEVIIEPYYASNFGEGVDAELPELLFTIEDEQGQVALERRSFVDARRSSYHPFALVFAAPELSGEYQVQGRINPPPSPTPETDFDNNQPEAFSFTVNQRLTLDSLGGPYVIDVGETFTLSVSAQDSDGDPLTFVLAEAPAGMQIEPIDDHMALITWSPSEAQGLSTHFVEVEVDDGFHPEVTGSFAIEVKRRTDLAIIKTTPHSTVVPGLPITYELAVSHLGPANHVGATVFDDFDPRLVEPVWTCTATPGSACTASGSGAIEDFDVQLARDGVVTYSVSAIVAADAQGLISNQACVHPDPPVIDENTTNNCDSVAVTVSSLDFGDAPDASLAPSWQYAVRLAEDGARHGVGALHLGSAVDGETEGQPSLLADGDDQAGDDEDGLVISELKPGLIATITAVASAAGLLSGWLDWNADGDWLDLGEQILADVPLVADVPTDLSFEVPAAATSGSTLARFRLSTQPGLTSFGVAPDGEVEDHRVEILPPLLSAIQLELTAVTSSLPEPGGPLSLAVRIENIGETEIEITSLIDDEGIDLNGQGTCALPQTLEVAAVHDCAYTASLAGNAGATASFAVTAMGSGPVSTVEATASESVILTDVLPAIGTVKTASPTELPAPGGEVTFMIAVANTGGVEPVQLIDLVDDVQGDLNGRGDCVVPQLLAVATTYSCQFVATVTGSPGDVEIDTVTATAEDDEGNSVQASDTAMVTIGEAQADLTISKTDERTFIEPEGTLVYTIEVENRGPSGVVGAVVSDPLPSSLTNCQWACAADQGVCGESGSGDLVDEIELETGGLAVYSVECDVEPGASGWIVNTAMVEVPADVVEIDATNNEATDHTEVAMPLFEDGFESGLPDAWSGAVGMNIEQR